VVIAAGSTATAAEVDGTGRPTTDTVTAVVTPAASKATSFMLGMMRAAQPAAEWSNGQSLLPAG
jgi:hypothetical protein